MASLSGSADLRNGCGVKMDEMHSDITGWLKNLSLYEQYSGLFEKFTKLDEIIEYSGHELLELGVKNAVHRTQLQSGLAALRMEKCKKASMNSIISDTSRRNHTNSTPPSNALDNNMNRILVVSSDEENYINRQTATGKPCNLNASNNNNNNDSDADDIRSHLWYHGSIGRSRAEAIVAEETTGQFLVRDCISRAGNYVLTCQWKGKPLHFMINRTVLNGGAHQERVAYNFEDESYRSVPDLIRAYVGQKKSITEESQCIISKPINRSLLNSPLRSKSGSSISLRHTVWEKSIKLDDDQQGNYVRMKQSDIDTTPNRNSISINGIANLKIPRVPESMRNRPLPPVPPSTAPVFLAGKSLPLRNRVMLKEARRNHLNKWRSESALEDRGNSKLTLSSPVQCSVDIEEPVALHASTSLQSLDNGSFKSEIAAPNRSDSKAPAKPKRAPSLKNRERPTLVIKDTRTGRFRELTEIELLNDADYEDDEGDYHEYCDIDYDQLPPEHPVNRESTPPPLPPRPKSGTVGFSIQDRDSACVPDMIIYDRPNELCKPYSPRTTSTPKSSDHYDVIRRRPSDFATATKSSRLKLDHFHSSLLPTDVKPLDNRVWPRLRDLLIRQDAQTLADAAMKMDIQYLNLLEREKLMDVVGDQTLPSLILLPFGCELRTDITERATCTRLFVASTLLHDETSHVRLRILSKWIRVADLVIAKCGNQFTFGSIMAALTSTQVSGLSTCWKKLQTEYPDQSELFENCLRPRYGAMRRSQTDRLSSIDSFVPDLLPISQLLNIRTPDEMQLFECPDDYPDDPYGIDSFWQRLQEARQWPMKMRLQSAVLQLNSLTDTNEYSLEMDIFRTEFHLRYLFGSKGCTVAAEERYSTFQRILNAMALNAEGKFKHD